MTRNGVYCKNYPVDEYSPIATGNSLIVIRESSKILDHMQPNPNTPIRRSIAQRPKKILIQNSRENNRLAQSYPERLN